MKKFLPLVLALAFTALALGITLFIVRPGIRSEEVTELAEPER